RAAQAAAAGEQHASAADHDHRDGEQAEEQRYGPADANRAERLAVQKFPALASSMSLICQPPPAAIAVTAYCVVVDVIPLVAATFCVMLTTKMIEDGPVPNERIETIWPLLVA